MLNVKHVIMINKIHSIITEYVTGLIGFNEAQNKLCDLHNVMLRSRNKWRLLACFFIGLKVGDLIYLFF